MTTPESFGKHYLVDLMDCDPEILKSVERVREVFVRAAKDCGATVIDDLFHQYDPFGVSGVVLIAESHLAVHTWPENSYAGVDIFTCGEEMSPEIAIEILAKEFQAKRVDTRLQHRGMLE
jgi:S-adenosylmethionine decarboxylase